MKKILMILMAVLLLPAMMSAKGIYVFIVDNDGPVTNIRNAPNGKMVATLLTKEAFVVELLKARGDWFQIDPVIERYGDNEGEIELEGSNTGYWIHNSLLMFTIAGDPTGCLRTKPSRKSKAVRMSPSTEMSFRPIAVQGHWVKAVTTDGKYSGWIHRDKICFNPLTTCP